MSVMYIFIGFWNFNPQKNSTRLKQEYQTIFNVSIYRTRLGQQNNKTQIHLYKFQNFETMYFSMGCCFHHLNRFDITTYITGANNRGPPCLRCHRYVWKQAVKHSTTNTPKSTHNILVLWRLYLYTVLLQI